MHLSSSQSTPSHDIVTSSATSAETIFSRETFEALCELGGILKRIRIRLVSEGYSLGKDGKWDRPKNSDDDIR